MIPVIDDDPLRARSDARELLAKVPQRTIVATRPDGATLCLGGCGPDR